MSEPLRIAHLLPWGAIGGTEISTLRAARAAAGFGAACRLFLPAGAVELAARATAEGLESEYYGWAEPSLRHPLPYWRANRRMAAALAAWGATVLHTAEVLAAFRLSLAGRLAGIPVLCHVRNRQTYFSRRDRVFLLPVSRYVFVSESTRRTFGVPVPDRRASVLYDALDAPSPPTPAERQEARAAVAREFGWPPDSPLVGMVGRIDPQKDYPSFLRAAARVLAAEPQTRFLAIGGPGPTPDARDYDRNQVRPLAAALDGKVVFTGFRPDAARLMSALDVFALATHFEGLPLVLLEAMARGVPVCATAVDGVPEALAEGAGLLHPHQDDAALAADVLGLLRRPDRARALGVAGRRRVETVFSPAGYARELEALYRSLTGSFY